jgi:hypothetical protein
MTARRDEDVARLDVAVHDTGGMRSVERICALETVGEGSSTVGLPTASASRSDCPSSSSIAIYGWPACSAIS